MSDIDWDKVEESIPSTAAELLKVVRDAYESESDDAARAVEIALREKLATLTRRFEAVKEGQHE